MAEVTAMRNNALPYPLYGVAWTVVAPLLDADGDPVSPSSPDSEVSKNGDTFTDCTNEMTELATSSGVVYLTLTSTEMTADIVTVQLKSTGAKTTIITLYPRKLVVLSTGTCQGSNDTGDIQLASGDSPVDDIYNGCVVVAVIDGTTESRLINDYVGSTKVAEVSPAWNTAQPDSNDTYTIYLPDGRQFTQADVRSFVNVAATSGAIPAAVAGAAGGLFIAGSNAATTTAGLTTGALSCTTITASGTVTLNALTVTNATTLSGAVSLGSTLNVTGATTLAALSTSGTVTFNALTVTSVLTVSGAMTLTGAVTASNASNNIQVNLMKVNSSSGGIAGFQRAIETIVEGTVGSASTTTDIVTSSLSPSPTVTDQLKGRIVIFAEDTATAALRGQASDITASTAGGILTVSSLTTAPSSGDLFIIQ